MVKEKPVEEKSKAKEEKLEETKETPGEGKPKITKDMVIHDVVMNHPETFPVFQKYGIGCVGCMFAGSETIEQGIGAHGIDVDRFVKELNEVL